ncbi:MAG: hypothetical protein NVS9B10_10020 [Nevskia sp.]
MRLRLAAGLLALAGVASASAAPSPLALSCNGCHQAAVNSPEMPALSTMTPAAIEAALKAARDRPQTGSIMSRFVAKMSDAELAALAAETGAPQPASKRP